MENNQENPTQDSKQNETANGAIQEQEFKFVIIGGNDEAVNEHFLNSLKQANVPVTIFEMTTEEMKFIINSRAIKKAEETSVEYLNDESNKKNINDWVVMLIKNHLERMHPKNLKELEYQLTQALDGKQEVFFTKKNLKQASKLSWSQFEELFRTLELFGVVKYCNEENPDLFSLIVNKEDIIKNQIFEAKQFVNLTIGKIQVIQNESSLTAKDKTKFESIRKSLLKISDKI